VTAADVVDSVGDGVVVEVDVEPDVCDVEVLVPLELLTMVQG
jgi:hypothetical protein